MAPVTTRRLSTAEVEHWKIDIDLEMEGFVELIISPRGRWPGQGPPVVTGTARSRHGGDPTLTRHLGLTRALGKRRVQGQKGMRGWKGSKWGNTEDKKRGLKRVGRGHLEEEGEMLMLGRSQERSFKGWTKGKKWSSREALSNGRQRYILMFSYGNIDMDVRCDYHYSPERLPCSVFKAHEYIVRSKRIKEELNGNLDSL